RPHVYPVQQIRQLSYRWCLCWPRSNELQGSITSQYVLGLRATNCRSGEILDDEQVRAPKKEDVLNALSGVASNFRTNAGESLATVKQRAAPIRRCHYTIALGVPCSWFGYFGNLYAPHDHGFIHVAQRCD